MLVLWLTADGQVSHYYVIFFVFYITVISFAVIRVISAVSWDASYGISRLERKTFPENQQGDMEGKLQEGASCKILVFLSKTKYQYLM